MREEALDWLFEAEGDLEHARKSIEMGDYSWASFAAQQAAEKALKTLHLHLFREPAPRTHDLIELMERFRGELNLSEKTRSRLGTLSSYYFISRYPNAGVRRPSRSISKEMAEEALEIASEVVRVVGEVIRASEKG